MFHSPDKKKFHSDTDLTAGSVADSPLSGDQNVSVRNKRKQPDSEWTQAINDLSTELKNTINEWRRDLETSINRISESMVSMKVELTSLNQVTSEIKNDINSLRSEQSVLRQRVTELDVKCSCTTERIDSLERSVQFATEEQADLSKKVTNINKNIQEIIDLKPIVTELVARIDNLEQRARNCNIEICNIPERRNENLVTMMQNIGAIIKCNVQQNDIISIHRVPHAHQQSNKPKNIIVKFGSRILRDNVLSAQRLCKGFTTDQIGVSGTSLPIYMHEHLTLKNKQLFRECRDAAKQHNYRFVWVKHGTILVREKEGTRSFAIRNAHDITKIKPGYAAPIDNQRAVSIEK